LHKEASETGSDSTTATTTDAKQEKQRFLGCHNNGRNGKMIKMR
jgi:hypothetical protein